MTLPSLFPVGTVSYHFSSLLQHLQNTTLESVLIGWIVYWCPECREELFSVVPSDSDRAGGLVALGRSSPGSYTDPSDDWSRATRSRRSLSGELCLAVSHDMKGTSILSIPSGWTLVWLCAGVTMRRWSSSSPSLLGKDLVGYLQQMSIPPVEIAY